MNDENVVPDDLNDGEWPRMWPHLPEEEEDRRTKLAESLDGTDDEILNDAVRTLLSLREIVKNDGLELNLYANAPDWPFGGSGSSWLSWKLCDMKDIDDDDHWIEGEASEMGTERTRFESMIDGGDLNLWEIMAANPGCPGDLVNRMVRVPDVNYDYEQVRYCAAHNPRTPSSTLAWLIDRDYTPDEESETEDDDPSTEVREIALQNPATPAEVLIRWSKYMGAGNRTLDDGWSERRCVAANWAAPVDVLDRLSRDKSRMVRAAVAGNPCCPVDLLEMLSLDPDEKGWVQKSVLKNPSSSERAKIQAALSIP
jgi:hypothetical protein